MYIFISHNGVLKKNNENENFLNSERNTEFSFQYLSELMLIEDTNYLKYLPSQIASSAVALARITVTREKVWPKKFKSYSRYSLKQLSPVVQKQQEIFVESPTKPQQAIQDKYKSPKYGCVSFLRPVSLNLDEIEDDDDQY